MSDAPEPEVTAEPTVIPEPRSVTIVCPECGEIVRIRDVHAYVGGLHQRVCRELVSVNGEE